MERGEFDDLPGAGKPIEGLGAEHDPDWWLKKLVERERIAGAAGLACSCARRTPSSTTGSTRLNVEREVRREVEDFNERVIRARYRPAEGPPLITMPRDVDDDGRRLARPAYGAAEARRAARAAEQPDRRSRRTGARHRLGAGWRRRAVPAS